MAEGQLSHSRQLADFVAGLDRDDIPDKVVRAAKRSLIDWLAAVLAGCEEAAAARVRGVMQSIAGERVATSIGTDVMSSAPFAALANGYASHLQDYDDVFNPPQTTVHLGSCVWPVVLALGEARSISGCDALTGYLAGFETGARVGIAAGVTHFESSWQVSGTAGHLASAAAAARVLRLDGARTVNAFGMAAAQASGIREIYGTETKALQPAKSAMDGVLCGLLAEAGITSSDTALEGARGLLSVISQSPDPEQLVAGLGETWQVLYNGHKLYPSASLNHPAVDAAIEVRRRLGDRDTDVAAVEVRMLPFAAGVTATVHPAPGSAAKFSTPHCVAVALCTGGLGLDDFTTMRVNDAQVSALRERVRMVPDPAVTKRGAIVTVTTADGRQLREVVDDNRGTPENPLSDQELEDKLHAVGSRHHERGTLDAVINACWDLDFVDDITDVIAPLRAGLEGVA